MVTGNLVTLVRVLFGVWSGFVCLLCVGIVPLHASDSPDFDKLTEEAVQILSEYLKVDTSNPPGNEREGADFLGRILEKEGIPHEIFESAPHRATLYARIKGTGPRLQPPIVLLHHLDVVPANVEFWAFAPFSGKVENGHVWGRGALDAKGLGVVHLMAFLTLWRSQLPLNRDVIYLATADEESGGRLGVQWFLNNHFNLVQGAELVFNEGGSNIVQDGALRYVGVEVDQKSPLWLRIGFRGPGGHGSIPRPDSSAFRLIRALGRVAGLSSPLRVTPSVAEYFRSVAPFQEVELQQGFRDIEPAVQDPQFVRRLPPFYRALLQDTISLTVLRGGEKTNVIPEYVFAELDCRLLPGADPQEFRSRLIEKLGDPAVEVETLLEFSSSPPSEPGPALEVIQEVTRQIAPEVTVGPSVLPGFTDSRFFREKGIRAYGFSPFPIDDSEARGVHATDERISIQNLRFGMRYFYRIVSRLVYGK